MRSGYGMVIAITNGRNQDIVRRLVNVDIVFNMVFNVCSELLSKSLKELVS